MNKDDNYEETAEKRLAELIKEAGRDARLRKKKVMEQHYAKLRRIIKEAVANREQFIA
jgi:hypothetical protein